MSTKVSPNERADFQPRYVGPIGNRVSAIAGEPGDSLVYYAGSAAGGIFKTRDGGTTWIPIFDDQATRVGTAALPEKVASIGALAVSESNPDVVWAGTGESWIRTPISIGNGVYKSADAGASWTRMGLPRSGRIAKIVIHPSDPNRVWVAAMGSCYDDPQQQRGVYLTTDGGLTWQLSLSVNDDTGCCDLAIDPNNPTVLYAGMWQFALRSWIRVSGGPGGGLYKSEDSGVTWRELTSGLPTGEVSADGTPLQVGKMSVGVARSDSDYVYANIETGDGVPTWDFPDVANGQLWQSTDAGETWHLMSYNRWINSRPAYYTRNAVSPDDRDEVYFLGPKFVVTKDGGRTLSLAGFPGAPGVDHHEAWIDPTNGDRMAVAHDSGVSITQNRGRTWLKVQLPIAQVYQANVDDRIPYNVFGNVQDWVGTWGPSNSRIGYNQAQGDSSPGPIPRGLWTLAGGGESGYSIPDPKDSDLIWTSGASDGANGGVVALVDRRTGHVRDVTVKNEFTTGTAPKDVAFRFHWHMPLAVSPHDRGASPDLPNLVYAGSQYVHATGDRGQGWRVISPELTGRAERYLRSSGGLTADNLANRMAFTTSTITESPCAAGLLWVGTNDQRVWLGRKLDDDWEWGWSEVTANIPGLPFDDDPESPPWGAVSCIAASWHAPGTAYATFDFHEAADNQPYIYKTADSGETWTKISEGIPASVFSYVRWIAEDPVSPELLFAGTENALYVTFDGGDEWQVLPGLPPAPVSGMVVQQHFHDLVVSTFGRGFWIFDDITPLRDLAESEQSDVHLFDLSRPVYRYAPITAVGAVPNDNDPTIGINPPSPAPISFYLSAPSNDITIRITTANGEEVRCLDALTGHTGINRVWWDLQSNTTETIRLRTNPADQVETPYCGPARRPDGSPAGGHIRPYSNAIGGTSLSWLVPPGTYQVHLEVDAKRWTATRDVVITKDPTSDSSLADIMQQHELSDATWRVLNGVALDINVIEWVRFQIAQLSMPADDNGTRALIDRVDHELLDIDEALFQRNVTGQGEDLARFPAKLVVNLAQLGGAVASGDYAPTDSQREQFAKLQAAAAHQHERLRAPLALVAGELNSRLRELDLRALTVAVPITPLCALFDPGSEF